jgi:hypothetical protein
MNLRILFLVALAAIACKKDTIVVPPSGGVNFTNGVLISNEGPFLTGTGTLSFYNPSTKVVVQDVFESANGQPIGNILNSMVRHNGLIYLVVNNSGLVWAVDQNTLQQRFVLTGFQFPSHAVGLNNTLFISDFGRNQIYVVSTPSQTVLDSIAVPSGPGAMLLHNNQLLVAHPGGFGTNNVITVINPNTFAVQDTLVVHDSPNSLVRDASGDVWVLCGGFKDWGNPANNTAGKLIRLDGNTLAAVEDFDFTNPAQAPGKLTANADGTKLFCLTEGYGGDVLSMPLPLSALPNSPFASGPFYGLGVHPSGEVYASKAYGFTGNGAAFRFDTNGNELDSIPVGIAPNGFLF